MAGNVEFIKSNVTYKSLVARCLQSSLNLDENWLNPYFGTAIQIHNLWTEIYTVHRELASECYGIMLNQTVVPDSDEG